MSNRKMNIDGKAKRNILKPTAMKKIFTILFIASLNLVSGQNPIYFTDTNAAWNVAFTYPHGNLQYPNFVETITKIYGYIGDTLIGNVTWNKLYCTTDSSFMSGFTYLGNIREENGQVFYMDTTSIIDTLYDFNLQAGDSVYYNFEDVGITYLKVTLVDDLEIGGGHYKRIHFGDPQFFPFFLNEVWIEGIGSIHGPLFPHSPMLFTDEYPLYLDLTCYKVNDSVLWDNEDYDECYIMIVLSVNEIGMEEVNIYPNPVTNELIIQLPDHLKGEYRCFVYDLLGQKVIQQSCFETIPLRLNISSLKKGCYILHIEGDREIARKMFIRK